MMALVVIGFMSFDNSSGRNQLGFTLLPLKRLLQFSNYWPILLLTTFFWMVLFSWWQVDGDYSYFLERLRIKVPFLLVPLGLLGLPSLSKKSFNMILYFFMVIMGVSVAIVLYRYALHFEEYNLLVKQGRHILTPCNHLRFSQLIALAVIAGWYLIKVDYQWKNIWDKKLIKILTAFLFIALHVLSVKTGLICLYSALMILVFRHIYTSSSYKGGLIMIVTLIVIPLISYFVFPSFQEKVHYTLYDFEMYQAGKGEKYGDSGRIASFKVGLELFKESPIVGVGAGNLKGKVEAGFKTMYPEYDKALMPHNQFLFVLAGSGIMGLSLILAAFIGLLIYRKAYRNDFYLGLYIVFVTSFMIDYMLENALGVSIFLSFLLLGLLHIHHKEITSSNELAS